MGKYVDGFVIPLAENKIEDYRRLAEVAGEVWIEHGALQYFECIADDLETHCTAPFGELAGVRDGETIVFAYIVYASREDRDRINKAVTKDPRMKEAMEAGACPFDPERMAFAGFRTIVEASGEQG